MPWGFIILAGILALTGWWSTQPLGYIPFLNIPIPNPLEGYSTMLYVAAGVVALYGFYREKGVEKR